MIYQKNKKESFEFEKYICFKRPELWLNEAYNLFASAQILYEYSQIQNSDFFNKENQLCKLFSDDIANKSFFNSRIIRMLWGFGFENLLKGIIVMDLKLKDPMAQKVPLNSVKGHNLLDIFKTAGFILDKDQEFFVKITQICSIWMGRYPLPICDEHMYEQNDLYTIEDQQKVYELRHKKWLKGERVESESDILHTSIGKQEYDIINQIINFTKEKFNEKLSHHNKMIDSRNSH